MRKIGFGGGCHWCTEAVFSNLLGVTSVLQGWIKSSKGDATEFSEAVIVKFDETLMPLDVLIEIHLHTHSATAQHSMRWKYRSAVYTFTQEQESQSKMILEEKQSLFEKPLVTKVYPFKSFQLNKEEYLHYYEKNASGAFCKRYIEPKLQLLLAKYNKYTK